MTKADLKNGMIARFREGNYYLYIESCDNYGDYDCGIFIDLTKQGWNPLADYDDNLKMPGSGYESLDIIAVYQPKAHEISGFILNHDDADLGDPIWEEATQTVEVDTTVLF